MNKIFEKIQEMPLIAILRGIKPKEAVAVSDILIEAGFTFIEVTLNSPDWQDSMRLIAERHGDNIVLGAGTVLTVEEVQQVKDVGGHVIISPNMNEAVIRKSVELNMVSIPGCYTPSECFQALSYGANIIKIFPADTLGPSFIKSTLAVLPTGTRICPTGGVTPDNMGAFFAAGIYATGIGSALYKAGKSLPEIGNDAKIFIQAYHQAKA